MSSVKAYQGAGTKDGLEIFRIEKLEPTRIDKATYGQFYSGDSYILLKTTVGSDNRISWDIHFWLGNDSSQDEQGAAAIMTVELDDHLGGAPVQHREVQGHESNLFLSYFKEGIRILEGGVASAFNHVDPTAYKPRLLQCKGKRNVRVTQVNLARASLNEGDVFILDAGMKLYQWNGKEANKYEKFKGLNMITHIKDEERGGKPETVFLESGGNDKSAEAEDFWKLLGGKGAVSAAVSDEEPEQKGSDPLLFKVSNASGKMKMEEVAKGGQFDRTKLEKDDAFILDSGTEIFVWIGSGATKEERKEAMSYAEQYKSTNKRPDWTPVTKVVMNGETPVFKSFFKQWDAIKTPDMSKKTSKGVAKVDGKSDTSALRGKAERKEETMVDDGKGKLTIWRIENFDKVKVSEDSYGQFYAGDSYICLYEYVVKGKENQIIYFWQGKDSTQDEKGASALLSTNLADDLKAEGKSPVQVRVVQNKEPNHFYALFKGKFIVRSGGKASGFKNVSAVNTESKSDNQLFQVKGSDEYNTRAVQVGETASSLNSGDVFILLTPRVEYLWYGSGANTGERNHGKSISKLLKDSRTITEVEEGKEPAAFWEALGGKAEYTTTKEQPEGAKEPRLFQGSNATGRFLVEEIFNFSQEDLTPDDVFLLDTYNELWVWVGVEANEAEKKEAFTAALDYVANAPDGRSADTPVMRVDCGREPPLFTQHFIGWDPEHFNNDPYLSKLIALKGTGAATRITNADEVSEFADPKKNKFPYKDLKDHGKPKGVDPSHREKYLADDEFKTVMGCTPAEFEKMAAWKQKQIKQKVGLF